MVTAAKNTFLVPSKAPNLPIAPVDYTQQYQDQINNALRLYFNQIDNFTQGISTPDSGTTVNRPKNNLFVGQQYFDTTINRPIWWTGTVWINASGTTV